MTQSLTSRVSELRPAVGEVRVRIAAVGLSALGTQVTGTVDAVARDSIGFARGDRVAFRGLRPEADRVIVQEHELIGVPADVSFDAAAGWFPSALLARTVTRQVHSIGSGDRVAVTDRSAIAPFIRAWAEFLGAQLVEEGADVTITSDDLRAARGWKSSQGSAQQAASDVWAAVRGGAFVGITFSTPEQARQGSRSPVLLHPSEVTLAA
ncbi:MAG: hypothetical protein KF761_00470 [Salinibacterium sp.]|nr:hypothetical protein [Salinibacterium sp.]